MDYPHYCTEKVDLVENETLMPSKAAFLQNTTITKPPSKISDIILDGGCMTLWFSLKCALKTIFNQSPVMVNLHKSALGVCYDIDAVWIP